MTHQSNVNGNLVIPAGKPARFEGPRHRATVLDLADAALNLAIKDRLIAEGYIDEKTGLKNGRAFNEEATELIREAKPGDISLIFFDLDKLKSVNDTVSWTAGDKYKITAGQTVAQEFGLRDTDKVYLIGGDEIVIIADHRFDESQKPVDFVGITSRVQEKVAKKVYDIDELAHKPGLGVSAGWATYEPEDTLGSLIDRAHDMALEQKNQRYELSGEHQSRQQDSRL